MGVGLRHGGTTFPCGNAHSNEFALLHHLLLIRTLSVPPVRVLTCFSLLDQGSDIVNEAGSQDT